MRAARESGLRVPEDFGVVGVGNLLYGEHLRIPLSSVEADPTQVEIGCLHAAWHD